MTDELGDDGFTGVFRRYFRWLKETLATATYVPFQDVASGPPDTPPDAFEGKAEEPLEREQGT